MTTTHEVIERVCGDTWIITGLLEDAEGSPLPIAGATISWKLDDVDGQTNWLNLGVNTGITITDLVTAAITIEVTPTQSATVPPGHYYDWLRVVLPSGRVFTEWTGVIKAVTNPVPT